MKRQIQFILIIAMMALLQACSSINEPDSDEILSAFEVMLPEKVEFENFTVNLSENIGTEVEPIIRSRIKGELELKEPRYKKINSILDKAVLEEVMPKGKKIEVFAIANSNLIADKWNISFDKVNIDPQIKGKLKSTWNNSGYVLSGSSDEKKLIENREKHYKEMGVSTPDGAMMAVVQALKANDIKSLMQASMNKEEYDRVVAEFEKVKFSPSESDKAQFQQMMGMLTNDGAVDQLMAMATPKLEQMRAQLPMMLMMGKGMASSAIQSSADIPTEQKETATKVVNALMDFVSENDILSEEVTRKAISAAVETAKNLNMTSLDDLQNMSFDDAMGKASIAMGGAKNILDAYGISLDDVLSSIEVTDVSNKGDSASMKMAYKFLGETFSQDVKMLKKDGKWVADK